MKNLILFFALILGVGAFAQTITIDGKKSKLKLILTRPDTTKLVKPDTSQHPVFNEPLELPEKQPPPFTPEGSYTAPNAVIRIYVEVAYRWTQFAGTPQNILEEIGRQIQDFKTMSERDGIRMEISLINIRTTAEPEYDMTNPNQILPSFAARMNVQYPPDKPRPFDFAYLWDLSIGGRNYGEMVYRNSISNPYGSFGIICAFRHYVQSTQRFPNYDWSYMVATHGFGHFLGLAHTFTCDNLLPNGTVGNIDSSSQASVTCNPPRKCRANMLVMGYGDQCYGGSKNPKYGFGRVHGAIARTNYTNWSRTAPQRTGLVTIKPCGITSASEGNNISITIQVPNLHNAISAELLETYNDQVNPTLIQELALSNNGPQNLSVTLSRTRVGKYDYQVRLVGNAPMSQSNLSTVVVSGVPPPPPCTYTYSNWSDCQPNGTQTRAVVSQSPNGCTGTPVLIQSCTYGPPVVQDGVIGPVMHYTQNSTSFFRFGIPTTGDWRYEVAYCRYDGTMNPPDSVTPPAACGIRNALNFSRPTAAQFSAGQINLQAITQPNVTGRWYRVRVRYRNGASGAILVKQSSWFWW